MRSIVLRLEGTTEREHCQIDKDVTLLDLVKQSELLDSSKEYFFVTCNKHGKLVQVDPGVNLVNYLYFDNQVVEALNEYTCLETDL